MDSDRPELVGLKVLLVDDHRDSADSMAWLLQSFGCEAHARFDATSALADVEALCPDVALLDIRLPDMSGIELCRRLRALPSLEPIVLVAVTGASDDRTQEAIREAGFDHALTKPVELSEMLSVLRDAASS